MVGRDSREIRGRKRQVKHPLGPKSGLAALVCAALLMAACGSSDDDSKGGGGTGGTKDGESLKIVYVRDVPQPAPFDAPIVKGYKAAGKHLGDDVVFQGAPANTKASDPAQEKRLIQNAVASK